MANVWFIKKPKQTTEHHKKMITPVTHIENAILTREHIPFL